MVSLAIPHLFFISTQCFPAVLKVLEVEFFESLHKYISSLAAKQGVILKLIQYLIQEREREALNFSGNNTKLVDELKKYLAQIPKDKIETLKVKNGEEIQNIFKKSIEPLINYLGKSGALN